MIASEGGYAHFSEEKPETRSHISRGATHCLQAIGPLLHYSCPQFLLRELLLILQNPSRGWIFVIFVTWNFLPSFIALTTAPNDGLSLVLVRVPCLWKTECPRCRVHGAVLVFRTAVLPGPLVPGAQQEITKSVFLESMPVRTCV